MIVIDCIQQTEEWYMHRKGIPTASEFSKIITSQGKLSKSRTGYIAELLTEMKCNSAATWVGNEHTERGNELEPDARAAYEFIHDCEVEQVGFCLTDDRRSGCSPDGFVNNRKGGVEIKCPKPEIQIERIMKNRLPPEYAIQVHGCMYVTGCEYWDFMSYAEGIDPFILRIERDDLTEKIGEALDAFHKDLESARKKFGLEL